MPARDVVQDGGLDLPPGWEQRVAPSFHHEGRVLLLFDAAVPDGLSECTLAYEGNELTIRPPAEDE